jgi:hypothetical protein
MLISFSTFVNTHSASTRHGESYLPCLVILIKFDTKNSPSVKLYFFRAMVNMVQLPVDARLVMCQNTPTIDAMIEIQPA